MALASVTTTYRFTPPTYDVAGTDNLDVVGFTLTPTTHVPILSEVGSTILLIGNIDPGIITGYYTVISIVSGSYIVDRSAGIGTEGVWRIGGLLPFLAGLSCTTIGASAGLTYSSTNGSDFDGTAQPGCVAATFGASGAGSFNIDCQAVSSEAAFPGGSGGDGITWERLGVPAGKHALYCNTRFRGKSVQNSGANNTVNFTPFIGTIITGTLHQIMNLSNLSLPANTDWTTSPTDMVCVPEVYSPADTNIILGLEYFSNFTGATNFTGFFDTLEITTFYDDEWCDYCTDEAITPDAVTLSTGQSQSFVANVSLASDFAITETGGGSLSSITDTSVEYTAPMVAGIYHLVASQACRYGNTAEAVITVADCAAFPCAGGTVTFAVSSTGSIAYSSTAPWITVSGPASGSGTVTLTIASNAGGSQRSATVFANDKSVTIIQLGGC